MEGAGAGGVDPRVELISQRLKQLQQMQETAAASAPGHGHGDSGSHGHSHGDGEQCDGHGHNPVMMQAILQRMQTFIQKQASGVDNETSGPENQAKALQALQMIQRLKTGMGGQMGMDGMGAGMAGAMGMGGMAGAMGAGMGGMGAAMGGMGAGMGGMGAAMGGMGAGMGGMGAGMGGMGAGMGGMPGAMGMPIPMGDGSHAASGHQTGLEGLPIAGAAHREPLSPDEIEKRKVALMAGDIAANAPHNQKNWIKYPKSNSDGPMESILYGFGHFTPPVFGWGELVKEADPLTSDKIKKAVPKYEGPAGHMSMLMPHETDSSGGIIYKTLPIVGRIRFLTDLQGLFFWTVVVWYWMMGNYSTWFCVLLPQYADGNISIIWLIVYGIISALCITSHLRASTLNPGKVPYYVSEDSIDHPDWSYCHQCDCKRPPRAHHCRRCKQCVLKMDHHCPWINNCVGEENQWAFVQLVSYAQLISIFSLAFNILWYFEYLPECQTCDKTSFAIFHQKFFITTVSVMAVLMMLFSMGLICSQNMSLMLDYTTLEWMQLERQVTASGQMPDPKDMPRVKGNLYTTYRNLCGSTMCIFWPFPCRRRIAPVLKRMEDV